MVQVNLCVRSVMLMLKNGSEHFENILKMQYLWVIHSNLD